MFLALEQLNGLKKLLALGLNVVVGLAGIAADLIGVTTFDRSARARSSNRCFSAALRAGSIGRTGTLEHAKRYPEDLAVVNAVSGHGIPVVTVLASSLTTYSR